MKNHFTLFLLGGFFLSVALACSNPLSRFTNQYRCQNKLMPEPRTADDYIKIAAHHLNENEADCAYGACAEAVRLEPKNSRAYSCRGQANLAREDLAAALSDYEQAIKLDPNDPFAYAGRSRVYQEKGQIDLALEDMTAALKLTGKLSSPDTAVIPYWTNTRGDLYFQKGDYQRAVSDFSEAIRLKPEYQYFYLDRAKAYRQMGQDDLAIADEAKAGELELAEKGGDESNANSAGSDTTGGKTKSQAVSGGVLNGKATSLPDPVYPPVAKAARASGTVVVRVTVDEKGDVISAEAVSGHPLLRAAAVAAARQAKFKPTLLNGKPVKVTGTLNYTFAAP
jgi:TonB family protein